MVNEFESAALGIPVGTLSLEDATNPPEPEAIASAARYQKFRLITLATTLPATISGFVHVGTTATYSASVDAVSPQLPTTRHFRIVSLKDQHWNDVTTMLKHAAPTRFSRDSSIDPERVRQRKLNILRDRHARGQGAGALAMAEPSRCIGFQYSYVERGKLILYELMTTPRFARGLLALELIAANVAALRSSAIHFDRVSTLIYTDNVDSSAFFIGLGLKPTGEQVFHYHLWL